MPVLCTNYYYDMSTSLTYHLFAICACTKYRVPRWCIFCTEYCHAVTREVLAGFGIRLVRGCMGLHTCHIRGLSQNETIIQSTCTHRLAKERKSNTQLCLPASHGIEFIMHIINQSLEYKSTEYTLVKVSSFYFPTLLFFLGRSSSAPDISSSSSSPPSSEASSISASLPLPPLDSCSESNSSATSESESAWKSSSTDSSSSSAEPRSGRPPSSLEPSSLFRAAAIRDDEC